MPKYYLQITPLDTLFFRDGKPFSKEESWADSSVLPYPSVVWGSLFSMLWSRGLVKKEEIEKLNLGKIFLYHSQNHRLSLPTPLDLFETKGYKRETTYARFEENKIVSNYSLSYLAFPDTDESTTTLRDKFIDINSILNSYQEKNALSLTPIGEFCKRDNKIGIARNNTTHATDEEALYRVEMTQLEEDWSFLVEIEFEGTDFPLQGLLKLGGEGKTASFKRIEQPYVLKVFEYDIQQVPVNEYFKLFFCSPVFFNDGWGKEFFEDNGFEVMMAFMGKSISIGGFDVKERSPKAMRKAIPAGSIFYLKGKVWSFSPNYQSLRKKLEELLSATNEKGFGAFEILPL